MEYKIGIKRRIYEIEGGWEMEILEEKCWENGKKQRKRKLPKEKKCSISLFFHYY